MGRRAALGLHRPMRLDPITINHLAFPISESARPLLCSHHQGRLLTLEAVAFVLLGCAPLLLGRGELLAATSHDLAPPRGAR
jgi:hypothetical protein